MIDGVFPNGFWTVFPADPSCMPQDFESLQEAKDYAGEITKEYGCACRIETPFVSKKMNQ